MRLALYLLGPPKLELNSAAVSTDRRKSLALLAYLALHREPHSREFLSALLWPEYEQDKAFTNLRHILWETQQAIGEGWIVAGRETLALIPESASPSERSVWVDVSRFTALVASARAQSDVSLRIPLLTESANLYRNHFLTGFHLKDAPHFDEWAHARAEELRHLLASALTMLSDDYASLGEFESSIPHALRLIALDPLNEDAHRQLMRIYVGAGQPNAALKQYHSCEKLLRKELGVDPQPETNDLYKSIRKGEIKPIQPAKQKEMGMSRGNLPFQISTFIGREKELDEIKDLITAHRLVSLVGTGGIGKTRLSLRMGKHALEEYPDGVWFVELAPLNDPALVAQTAAKLFHIVEQADESVTDKLTRELRARSALLILDNCEHLLDACAQLADTLLKNCPNLKLLATSREPLGITGEAVYHVPPLGLPEVERVLEKLMEYESIQLFVERARLDQERFALTLENASAIAKICRRLDGIPLAIELAAARVHMFSAEQIAVRLDESLNLLRGGSRATLPRHQTLRASIDWSWNLLSEPEQMFLRRLSVFAGGCTLEGAEAVGENKSEAIHLLDNLVEKSLVVFDSENERYLMLETIREYAFERLEEANEEDAARNRHLAFYVAMAEEAEPGLLGKEQGVWMQKLSKEQENIITANNWCSRSISRTELGFQLLGGFRYYWLYAGLASLGFKMYREALKRDKLDENTMAVGLTHDGVAIYSMHLNEPAIIEPVEKSIPIFQAHGDQVRLAMALTRKAWGCMLQGHEDEAIRIYEEAVGIGRQLSDKRPLSAALNNLAELFRMHEEYERAESLFEESLAIDREREDSTGIILGLVNISKTALMRGKFDTVRSRLTEAARIIEKSYLREYMQTTIETAAILRFLMGQRHKGMRLFGAAAAELKTKGNILDPADEKHVIHWIAKMREIAGEEMFAEAMAEGGKLSSEQAMAETREWLEHEQ